MNNPALWIASNDITRRHINDMSDEFSDEIGKMSGRCLDIGSGTGDAVVDFILPKLNKEATVVCSDISDEMVKFAKEKYKDIDRLSFAKLNIESPNLPEDLIEQFDHITSFFCVNWCQDMPLVFKNMFNLLRPGGTGFLIVLAKSPGLNVYKELAAMPSYQPYMKHFGVHIPVFQYSDRPRQDVKAIIKDAGFEVQHCSVRDQTYTFNSTEALSNLTQAIDPFIDCMPTNLAEEYRKDLVHGFAGHNVILTNNNKDRDDYSTMMLYSTFVIYLKKPTIE